MALSDAKYAVLPATQSDLTAIAALLQASKLPLVINRILYKDWPNEGAQLAQCTRAIQGGFKNPASEMLKVVDNSTDEIIGHLVLKHRNYKTEERANTPVEKPEEEQNVPDGMVPEVFHMVVDGAAEIDSAMEGIEHLGSDPMICSFACCLADKV